MVDVATGTFVFLAGADAGVTDGAALSSGELDVCTCSSADGFVFPNGADTPVFGAAVPAFDPDAPALGTGAGITAGPDSAARADEASETGGADAFDNDENNPGAGDGGGDIDGEGVEVNARA